MGVALSSCSPVKISGTRRALPDSEGLLQMFCLARRNSLSSARWTVADWQDAARNLRLS